MTIEKSDANEVDKTLRKGESQQEVFTFEERLEILHEMYVSRISMHVDETFKEYAERVANLWETRGRPAAILQLEGRDERVRQEGEQENNLSISGEMASHLEGVSGLQSSTEIEEVVAVSGQERVVSNGARVNQHEMLAEIGDDRERLTKLEAEYGTQFTVTECRSKIEALLQPHTKNESVTHGVRRALYEMLTRRNEFAIEASKYNNDLPSLLAEKKPLTAWYANEREKLLSIDKHSGGLLSSNNSPGWVGIDTYPQCHKREGLNLKVYTTLHPEDCVAIARLPELASKLRELAVETNDSIKVKMPNGYAGFQWHNDSVVVHFKNQANAKRVTDIVDEWVQEGGYRAPDSKRELGRTRLAVDASDASFTERVAETIADWATSLSDSYSPAQLAEFATLYAIERSQQTPSLVASEPSLEASSELPTGSTPEAKGNKEVYNPNSIGSLLSIGSKDVETHTESVYRSLGGDGAEAAIEDLLKSGSVRNKATAQNAVETSRWKGTVFWSRGDNGKHHAVQEEGYVLVAPLGIAQVREIRLADLEHVYTKRGGVVLDILPELRKKKEGDMSTL